MSVLKKQLCFFIFTLILIGILPSASAYQHDDHWKFSLTPYLWAIQMNGRVGKGPFNAHVQQSFIDALKNVDLGVILAIDAHKNRFGLYGNAMYSTSSDTTHKNGIKADSLSKFGVFGIGVMYQVWEYCGCGIPKGFILEPYAGLRYTVNNAYLTVQSSSIKVRAVNTQNWTDPLIGLQGVLHFTNAWHASLTGDLGGTNGTDHYSYSWMALIGYHPQTMWTNTTTYLGYHLLGEHYATGSGRSRFDWNVKLSGPIIGLLISF